MNKDVLVVTCEGLSIANGRVNYYGGQTASGGRKGLNTVAQVICNEGFEAPHSQNTCTIDGVWSPQNPTCNPSNRNSILV